MTASLAPLTLEGTVVRLVPLELSHAPLLLAVANADPALYTWTFTPRTADGMHEYVAGVLAARASGTVIPFAIVRRADERVVGVTRLMTIERWAWPDGHPEHGRTTPDACEIGGTWLGADAIRTPINTQAKRLLLTHAFESWHVHRVSLKTDVRNTRSRAAIERLGARFDGVARCDRLGSDGTVRDSAAYSIVASEWPAVRERLARLEARADVTG